MATYTEGQAGHLKLHADIDTLIAGHTTDIAGKLTTTALDAASTAVDANAASALRVQQDARLSATIAGANSTVVYVSPAGNDALSGLSLGQPKKTIPAAMAAIGLGNAGTIRLSPGVHSVAGGISWTGYKCGLIGSGALSTTLVATAQTGPVLDFSGAGYTMDGVEIGGFAIQGDNTAGIAKKGVVFSPTVSITQAWIHDISVRYTGGVPFDFGIMELSTLDRLVAFTPVSAVANDVPYIKATGAFNGNTFHDCLLIGTAAAGVASAGVSGAIVLKDDGTYAPELNRSYNFRIEHVALPTNGTLFAIAGNANNFMDTAFFDESKVVGATGTSYYRFTPPTVSNSGGNLVSGTIPGADPSNSANIDYGVDMRQGRNAVFGVKGYKGANLIVASGVGDTTMILMSAVSGATNPAAIDNSGVTTNTLFDNYLKVEQRGPWAMSGQSSGPQIYSVAAPANGSFALGNAGVKTTGVGSNQYHDADIHYFRNIANTAGRSATLDLATNTPSFTLPPSTMTLPTASAAYRGQLRRLDAGAGVADRLVTCRKDAAEVYAWVDLY